MAAQIGVKLEQFAELCRRHHVRRLALFGSAVREDFDPTRSDLDFLVEFEPLPPGTYADAYFGLLEGLQQLCGRRVDLVEAGSVRNPYVSKEIEARQETVYAA